MLNMLRSSPLLAACVAAAAWASAGLALAQTQAPVAQQRTRPAPPAAPAPERMTVPVFPTAPCGRVDIAPVVQVSVGKSTVIKPTTPVARILLGNPDGSRAARPTVASSKEKNDKDDKGSVGPEDKSRPGVADIDVLLLSPSEVYLLGRSIGSTNVVLLDKSGSCTAFDVVVNMDTNALQTIIGQLMPEEKNVRISSAFDSIVLSGLVTDPGAVTRITDLAKAYVRPTSGASPLTGMNPRVINMLSVGAPQQVMLEVKVAEISKTVLDKFGINFTQAFLSGRGIRLLNELFGGSGATASVNSTTSVGNNNTGQVNLSVRGGQGTARVDLQKTDGLVKILAEPTVMAISGKKGSFLAGGKIFIPVAQDDGSNGTKITLAEKEFGVSVAFLPTVLDGGRVDLEVATEVSELNREGIGISLPGVNSIAVLPAFTSRRAKTTVQLQDGQSFAIGGLIKNNTITNIKAFPVLGELPILGALFRSTEFQTDRSELVFVITPRLVKPLPPDFQLPTDNYTPPSRKELIIDGKLEGASKEGDPAAPAAAGSAPASGFQVK
jgi:pilus assembly protein CpaC